MLNKIDLIDEDTLQARREEIVAALAWQGPVYEISAVAGTQTAPLCGDLMTHLEHLMEQYQTDAVALEAGAGRTRANAARGPRTDCRAQ